ncbi:4Fe-4S binding protein [Clostridium omnivorum]|uniref:4Fe-4S ferredoxin n=1 Tax=Clostridium omnivorum TaxID=1604902 RepID=A0ABQ5NB55_9CLOT|nr:4Fe-4S binding protein [Clostridium sp. E14]GLC32488.1 4Fe-4S ferredoxin [Clostridium sp. E14]
MNNNSFIKYIRWIILATFLILITIQTYLHQVLGGGTSPSIHALCPYGGLESLYTVIFSGTFIQKIFIGTMTLLILTLLLSFIFRRSFCGTICPFGALQEFFGLLGKKIFRKRFTIPNKIDKPLRYLKYIVLLLTIIFAWKTAGLWVDPYDPWAAYGHISAGFSSLTSEYLVSLILLIVVLIGSMLYDRFFCKYLCPMGAVYGIISNFSPSKITRNKDKCINCNLCSKSCPVNIDVAHLDKVTSSECLGCQICVLSCPKKDALEYKTLGKALKPITVIILVVVIFFGGLFISKSTGLFDVLPKPVTADTKLNVEEIKGYMSLKDVSTGTGIEIKELYKKLEIPDSVPADTKLKDVKNYVTGFEVETAKEKLEGK